MTEQLKALSQAEITKIHEIAFEAGRATSVVDGLTERAMALVQQLAGFDQTPVKLQFQFRYMAGYMAKKGKASPGLLEEAELMRNAAGYGSEPKEGQSVRTAEWDMAYGAARKWWHKVLKKAKVATSEARGGAREGAGRDPSEVKAAEKRERRIPAVDNIADAEKWLIEETAALVAFVSTNHEYLSDTVGKLTDDYRKAIVAALTDPTSE